MPPAQVAKAALRRLALAKLEPTPENYAKAYGEELGQAVPRPVLPERALAMLDRVAAVPVRDESGRAALRQAFAAGQWPKVEGLLQQAGDQEREQSRQFASLIERLVRGLERSDRQWTMARKKESVQVVVEGSRGDALRLQRRLTQLVGSWESDAAPGAEPLAVLGDETDERAAAPVAAAPSSPSGVAADATGAGAPAGHVAAEPPAARPAAPKADALSLSMQDLIAKALPTPVPADATSWHEVADAFGQVLVQVLPDDDEHGPSTSLGIGDVLARLVPEGPLTDLRRLAKTHAREAERILRRREQLLQQTHRLCLDLADGLTDIAEDDSWARGQCEAMRLQISDRPSVRSVRSAATLLHHTRLRQRELRVERQRARDALKSMIHQMLQQVGELGQQTGRFHDSVGRYADVIEQADSLESLAGVVREMVAESRTVQGLVSAAQQRLEDEHSRASELSDQVQRLEDELRRLSDEVSTDQLTQIANRRGLLRAFQAECSRADRGAGPMALALLDVDDFKKLNDTLGHNAGDEALRSLAARVSAALRPTDTVARYGGEEFVVMLPATPLDEARQVLTRMQRAMTQALFMHDQNPVFVTFSAGVTLHREGESIEAALERADEGLYEAKRSGKNRVCVS